MAAIEKILVYFQAASLGSARQGASEPTGWMNVAVGLQTEPEKMRLVLLVAVIALAVDAINFSGAYSQLTWSALRTGVTDLTAELRNESIIERDRVSLTDDARVDVN